MRKLLCIVPVLLVLLSLAPPTWGETPVCGSCSQPCCVGKPLGAYCGTPGFPAYCSGFTVGGDPVLCPSGNYYCGCVALDS